MSSIKTMHSVCRRQHAQIGLCKAAFCAGDNPLTILSNEIPTLGDGHPLVSRQGSSAQVHFEESYIRSFLKQGYPLGTPKSSTFIGFSLKTIQLLGTPIYGNPHANCQQRYCQWLIIFLWHLSQPPHKNWALTRSGSVIVCAGESGKSIDSILK